MKKLKKYFFIILLLFIIVFYIIPKYIPFVIPQATTKYSKNYDEKVFNMILINTNQKFVDSILGKPIQSYEQIENKKIKKINFYSKNKYGFLEYEVRIIEFYDGKVKNKIIGYDID